MSQIEELPTQVRDTLRILSARKYQLDKSNIKGRPVFESLEEIALTYYAIKNTDISKVARTINYEIPALWRIIAKIEKENKASYWDTKESKIVTVTVTNERLLEIANELIKPRGKRIIPAVTDSAVIQEFLRNPTRIMKTGKVKTYTRSQIRKILRLMSEVAESVEKHKDIFERYGVEVTNNPDLWASNRVYEQVLSELIDRVCSEKYTDPIQHRNCVAERKMSFRKIPQFRTWFEGEIGAVKKRVKPIPETLWYSDYLKLKEYLLGSGKSCDRALWGVMSLHITLGCREGYESLRMELERLEAKGVKVDKSLSKIDLDDPIVNSSLIGLKWDKVTVKDNKITSIEVYESKTEKTWLCLGIWLDKDLENYLLKVREWALANNIKSVVKSILMYEGIKKTTVSSFREWYIDKVTKITKEVLGKELTPHRLRSAHVSILAEFGVPLELVCSDSGFGVGWEDLSTAVIFYLRFSRQKVDEYFKRISELTK